MSPPLHQAAEVAEHPHMAEADPAHVSIVRWLRPAHFHPGLADTLSDVLEQGAHFRDAVELDFGCLFEASDGRIYQGRLDFALVPAGPEEVAEALREQKEEEAG